MIIFWRVLSVFKRFGQIADVWRWAKVWAEWMYCQLSIMLLFALETWRWLHMSTIGTCKTSASTFSYNTLQKYQHSTTLRQIFAILEKSARLVRLKTTKSTTCIFNWIGDQLYMWSVSYYIFLRLSSFYLTKTMLFSNGSGSLFWNDEVRMKKIVVAGRNFFPEQILPFWAGITVINLTIVRCIR